MPKSKQFSVEQIARGRRFAVAIAKPGWESQDAVAAAPHP
jgi:hypothetical protein